MNPRLAHTQVILLHKHQHTSDILASSPGILYTCSFTGYTVGGGEDLGMSLLLREMYASAKGGVYGKHCTIQLPHTCPTMHCIPLVCLYMVRAYSVYTFYPICVRFSISTLLVHVDSCSRGRTERLSSRNQRNRDLKTLRKGRHDYQDGH